jgi:hypothetical protein
MAFQECGKLTSVTIPNSVTKIGMGAFADCTSLTSVTFSGSIPSSGFDDEAFDGLGDIRAKYLATGGGAGTYTRPNGGKTWTKGGSTAATPAAAGTPGLAFKLTSDGKGYSVSKGTVSRTRADPLVIPATYNNLPVKFIENSAFIDFTFIPSITIPASVTEISVMAFASCANLKSVTFEGANTSFGASEFPNGNDLRTKYRAGGAGTYTLSSDGKTWTKSASATAAPAAAGTPGLAFERPEKGDYFKVSKGTVTSGAVVIPATYNNLPVTQIRPDAFKGTAITSVTIPDSVTYIDVAAFSGCASLTSVTFGGANTSGDFPAGDLAQKYKAGGAGTYTRSGTTWTKK